jgi:hypothetical protein
MRWLGENHNSTALILVKAMVHGGRMMSDRSLVAKEDDERKLKALEIPRHHARHRLVPCPVKRIRIFPDLLQFGDNTYLKTEVHLGGVECDLRGNTYDFQDFAEEVQQPIKLCDPQDALMENSSV